MARRIRPHITVGYKPIEVEDLAALVERQTAALSPFRAGLGRPATWPDGGIYLPIVDLEGGFLRLRSALAELEQPTGIRYAPHVTLVHPHVGNSLLAAAWDSLSAEASPEGQFIVNTLSVITERPNVWEVTASISLDDASTAAP